MNLLGNIEFVDSIFDGPDSTELSGPFGLVTTEINGRTYVYVAGQFDDGIQILEFLNDGTLEPAGFLANGSSTNALNDPRTLEIVERGDEKYLIVVSTGSDSIASFRIDQDDEGTDGALTEESVISASSLAGNSNSLNDPIYIRALDIGNRSFLVVTASTGDALSTFEIDDDGTLSTVDAVFDGTDQDFELDGAGDVELLRIGNRDFAYVAGDRDNGISVWEIANNGTLSEVDNANLPNNRNPNSVLAANFNGENLLFVSTNSRTIQTWEIANDGTITFVTEVDPGFYLGSMKLINLDGVDFIAAQNIFGQELAIFSIDDTKAVQKVQGVTSSFYDGAGDIALVEVGTQTYLISAAFDEARVNTTLVGSGSDPILGTATDDNIVGLAGDDDLLGGAGNDLLVGGTGDDVLSGRDGNDTLEGGAGDDAMIGGRGNDRAIGGAGADFANGGRGVDTISYKGSSEGVEIDLRRQKAEGGDAEGDQIRNFENLTGSNNRDNLKGEDGDNRILGGNGDDILVGRDGRDELNGQGGNDVLRGGQDRDEINGGGGDDRLIGDQGNDELNGGGGNDLLRGGTGNDDLDGGSGTDELRGDEGNDTLTGGRDSDTFVFVSNSGDDVITDFEVGVDVMDFSSIAEISSLSDFRSVALNFIDDTLVQLDGGANTLIIQGLNENDFSAGDFIFV